MLNGPFKNGLLNSFDSEIIGGLNLPVERREIELPGNHIGPSNYLK